MADRKELYGAGFAYPAAIDPATGGFRVAEGLDSVRASLWRLLDTVPGEDLINQEYGCALHTFVFEQDTAVFRALCETAIRVAVAKWEPRIAEVLDVTVERDDEADPHTVYISVTFLPIDSQVPENLVYPFNLGG